MKVAIMYAPTPQSLEQSARALGRALEENGHRVEYLPMGKNDRPRSMKTYDFFYLGSVAEGVFGSKIPAAVAEYLKQLRGVEGTKSAAFLMKSALGLGNTKGLRRLMGILESAGSMVMDFQLIGGQADCDALAQRLKQN